MDKISNNIIKQFINDFCTQYKNIDFVGPARFINASEAKFRGVPGLVIIKEGSNFNYVGINADKRNYIYIRYDGQPAFYEIDNFNNCNKPYNYKVVIPLKIVANLESCQDEAISFLISKIIGNYNYKGEFKKYAQNTHFILNSYEVDFYNIYSLETGKNQIPPFLYDSNLISIDINLNYDLYLKNCKENLIFELC